MTLTERIERLERQNRLLRLLTIAVISTCTLLVLGGQESDRTLDVDVVTARSFVLRSPDGEKVTVLSHNQGSATLNVNTVFAQSVGMFTAERKLVGSMHSIENGSILTVTSVAVENNEGRKIAALGANDDGGGLLTLDTRSGKEVIKITHDQKGNGAIALRDSQGRALFQAGASTDGDGVVMVFDPSGRTTRGVLSTNE